jgi:hypothetical protein
VPEQEHPVLEQEHPVLEQEHPVLELEHPVLEQERPVQERPVLEHPELGQEQLAWFALPRSHKEDRTTRKTNKHPDKPQIASSTLTLCNSGKPVKTDMILQSK